MTVFDSAFTVVVGEEGGYTANPSDPGNWTGGRVNAGQCRGTKFGISAAAYPTLQISDLTVDDAKSIYQKDYWNHVRGDELVPALALMVFDAAINSGVARAIRWLQLAARVTADGSFGPLTMAAVQQASGNGAALMAEYQAQRLSFLAGLPTWRTFGLGWARRVCRIQLEALRLTGSN